MFDRAALASICENGAVDLLRMVGLQKICVAARRRWRLRKPAMAVAVLLVLLTVSGCRTLEYYGQAIQGQYQLLTSARKIDKLLADSSVPEELKERLHYVNQLRDFAANELHLAVNGQYSKYADVQRPYVVWNVQAAPEFSLEPKRWWYPFVGRLDYRGYFSQSMAQDYGEFLHEKGYDVYVGGVTAYSTLGWFEDPVVNTFLAEPKVDVAETLFHELAHQQVFASGDTDFNEAFATSVGQEGTRRWLRARGDAQTYAAYLDQLKRTREFAALVIKTRTRLEALYGDTRDDKGRIRAAGTRPTFAPGQLAAEKAALFERLRAEYELLKASWDGNGDYDGWFARGVNNAKLNSVAAYYDLVPGFERLLELKHRDLVDFYSTAKRLSGMERARRHEWLRILARTGTVEGDFAGVGSGPAQQ
jgi:predicted aminopeptidase